jgi:hypothetical protein
MKRAKVQVGGSAPCEGRGREVGRRSKGGGLSNGRGVVRVRVGYGICPSRVLFMQTKTAAKEEEGEDDVSGNFREPELRERKEGRTKRGLLAIVLEESTLVRVMSYEECVCGAASVGQDSTPSTRSMVNVGES